MKSSTREKNRPRPKIDEQGNYEIQPRATKGERRHTHNTSAKIQTSPANKKLRAKLAKHKLMDANTVTVTEPTPKTSQISSNS
jgi:hypothetical protein